MSDSDLERFDGLRVREVKAMYGDTASAFLATFRSTAASLTPDERIALVVVYTHSDMELLKAVLCDPQASKISALVWTYDGKEKVNAVIPLLIHNCPELFSLRVNFKLHSGFDFVSSVLEHPGNRIKALEIPRNTEGDPSRFFAALGQSRVSALTIFSTGSLKFAQGYYDYVARDLLVRWKVVGDYKLVPSEAMRPLADCTRLAELGMLECIFPESTAFTKLPKSITKLNLSYCTFADGFDWSFLADCNVRELDFSLLRRVDGDQLGRALAVHLRAKGLDKLRFCNCHFAKKTLAAVGVELGRVKRLDIDGHLNDASIALIALALQSPNSELRELELKYHHEAASSIETHLVPALKHLNCNLAKLRLSAYYQWHEAAAKAVEIAFHNRLALFLLLQGQQVRRLYCPLRRLPVEMFRMVGMVLLEDRATS